VILEIVCKNYGVGILVLGIFEISIGTVAGISVF